jgi:8-oxo-dGTP diphosphatase
VETAAAAALIFNDDGQVLLVREGYGRQRYNLPGGVVEAGESPRDAVIREAREELMVDVVVEELAAVYYWRGNHSGLRFFFRCSIDKGVPSLPPSGEVQELRWVDPAELPLPMAHTAPYAIADATNGTGPLYRELSLSA